MSINQLKKEAPVGIFDSGLGGLSIWKEMAAALPNESLIYFADSGNCPYGPRPVDEVRVLSTKIVEFFIEKKCKLIVVACNTVTGAAIKYLRQNYDIPFVGLEPAVKPAALNSKTGHVGILATKGTLESEKFKQTKNRYAGDVEVHLQIGEGLVEIVEAGEEDSPKTLQLLKQFINPMLDSGVDQIVLGCTHYPFLIPAIQKIVGSTVTILNPAPAVAKQTHRLLKKEGLLRDTEKVPTYSFFTSGKIGPMVDLIKKINRKTVQPNQITLH